MVLRQVYICGGGNLCLWQNCVGVNSCSCCTSLPSALHPTTSTGTLRPARNCWNKAHNEKKTGTHTPSMVEEQQCQLIKIAGLVRQEPQPISTTEWAKTLRFGKILRTNSVVRSIQNPWNVVRCKIHRSGCLTSCFYILKP